MEPLTREPTPLPVDAPGATPMATPQSHGTGVTVPDTESFVANSLRSTAQSAITSKLPATSSIKVGSDIDGYTILEFIGRGGMGVVFKARQPGTGQTVAVKMVRDPRFAGDDAVKRFVREFEALGRLQAVKNIVPVYHVGQYDDGPLFVMPLLAGGNLATRLARFKDNPRKAVAIVEKIARAVHQLHSRQILHRDIKPGNILLDADEEPYLADFGLAKLLDGDVTLTRTQERLGTPAYMAPEQTGLLPTKTTVKTDIWALGVVLYELITGVRPFHGDKADEHSTLFRRIVHDAPPAPRKLKADLDRGLEAIVLKCLEKDPRDRYDDANQLADDLQRWLNGNLPARSMTTALAKSVRRWSRKHPVTAILVPLMLAAIAVAVVAARPPNPERALRQLQAEAAAGQSITLINKAGMPRYHKVLTSFNGDTGIGKDGYFDIDSNHPCVVELMRGVPFAEYEFSATLRQNGSHIMGSGGLYISHSRADKPGGEAHFFYSWSYNDIHDLRSRARPAGIPEDLGNPFDAHARIIYQLDDERSVQKRFAPFASILFNAAGLRGGKWRDLSVRVYRDRMEASFDGVELAPTNLTKVSGDAADEVKFSLEGDPRHAWMLENLKTPFDAKGSLGIVADRSSLSVSRAAITPLVPR